MATEKYTTLGASTLASGVDGSTTTWPITSASSFPSAGDFRIRCDDEIVKVTGVSGSNFTVVRGQEGTSGASHSGGAAVTEVLTAAAINAIRSDQVQTGAYASAASEHAGNLYLPSDGYSLLRDTGAAFAQWGPVLPVGFQAYSGLTWLDQETALGDSNGGRLTLYKPPTTSLKVSGLHKSLTLVGGSVTFTCWFVPIVPFVNYSRAGVFFRENATTKFDFLCLYGPENSSPRVERWTGTTLNSSVYTSTQFRGGWGFGVWFRIIYDGTDVKFQISADGKYFFQVWSESKTAHFTTAPDQIGIGILGGDGNVYPVSMSVLSWLES